MTPERWQEISRIYHAALARPAGRRDAFLREACGEDSAMRREVASLLAQPSADGFLAEAAWIGTNDPDSKGNGGYTGRRFGQYQLRELLGAGGMGEVYRAHDSKLGREVAIKILPRAFTSGPDRLARFEREARLLAALNHPHIAAIYGVEETDDVRALVLELVEGETLAERLLRGPLPLSEALAIGRAIAEALDAAHEQGIVHRDLKPANVKVRPDGTVKVLDFGLAKAVADRSGPVLGIASPTGALSIEGLIVGTPGYMSPEQARGKPVDKRTDIWAFGCLLYEMLSGRPVFAGETAPDTIAAILERLPDLSGLPPSTPAELRRLIERCLTKDPRERLRDIGDARLDLDAIVRAEPGQPGTADRQRMRALPWIIAAASLALAAWIAVDRLTSRIAPTSGLLERLTHDSGLATAPALSPNGELMAYASDRAGRGDLDIWVQQAAGGAALRLTDDPADDDAPDFSPDGKQIVFRSNRGGGGVYLVSALGGVARLLVPEGRRPRFSPDGSRVAYWTGHTRGIAPVRGSGVFVASLSGGQPLRLVPDFDAAQDPVWAPDGRAVVILARKDADAEREPFDWWWVPIDGRVPVKTGVHATTILRDTIALQGEASPAAWGPSGLLFAARGDLWSVPISTTGGRPRGPAERLTALTARAASPTVGRDGAIVFAATQVQRAIERIPLASGQDAEPPVRVYTDNRDVAMHASATPDGTVVVYERFFETHREIWMLDARSRRQQMTLRTDPGVLPSATISPDGRRIAYAHRRTIVDQPAGYVVEVAAGVPRLVCEDCTTDGFLSDSRRLLVVSNDHHLVSAIDVKTGSRADVLREPKGYLNRPHASPDDRWLAFRRMVRGGASATYIAPLLPGSPADRGTWQLIDDSATGRPCGWSPEGSTAYLFLDTDGFRCLWSRRLDPRTGRATRSLSPARHFHVQMDDGPSTSFGNAVTGSGFLYERTYRTGALGKLTQGQR